MSQHRVLLFIIHALSALGAYLVAGDFCTERPPGNHADPTRCTGYITCTHGTTYKRQCPSSLHYNAKTDRCDWSWSLNPPCYGAPIAPSRMAGCEDMHAWCAFWDVKGFCEHRAYKAYMTMFCCKSCGGGTGGAGGTGGTGGAGGGCGKPFQNSDTGRIVGGHDAQQGNWPWQVGLRSSPRSLKPFCGGTLIKDDVVLTAAHCVARNPSPSRYWVRVGDHDVTRTDPQEENIQARRIIIHERHNNPNRNDNDIALIILSKKVKLKNRVQVACLPTTQNPPVPPHTENDRVKGECFATGWGTLKRRGRQPNILQEVQIPFYNRWKCTRRYRNIKDLHICAGYEQGGKDSCQGDSGGPFVCRKSKDEPNKFVVRGVTSFGTGCALPGWPGIYTNVFYYVDWINRNTA